MDPNSNEASVLLSSENLEAQKLFSLYAGDVEGAVISYRLFKDFKDKASQDQTIIGDMIYHASCFICASRRAARLLEALSANRNHFRRPVAKVIRLEWRKKRFFFDKVKCVRNAIEHIDSEENNRTKLSFFNMDGSTLNVTDEHSISIDDNVIAKVRSSREAIANAIISEYGGA